MFQLRPFQRQALEALDNHLPGRQNVICIAPTGSGKSLIYERLASRENRKTLLITPLVALARQQHQRLQKLKIRTFFGASESKRLPTASESGAWILSPELLQYPSVQTTLKNWKPDLLVVDECHCLWEWGEDFRPAFKIIPKTLELSSLQKSLWLTATLPTEAKKQLRKFLSPKPLEIGTFDIPQSIFLEVRHLPLTDRLEGLLKWINQQDGSGIIFVSTRDMTLRLARVIHAMGKKTAIYHAGLSREERQSTEYSLRNQEIQIIIATSAFGMGMDYPHLSFVALWQVPTSLLSLVQAIGRVGRSAETTGKAIVYWDFDDFRSLEWMIKNSTRRKRELKTLLDFFTAEECRRALLCRYFDSTPQFAYCEKCDFCARIAHRNIENHRILPIGRWLENC